MEKKDLIPRGDAIHYLKTAALLPQRRDEMIGRALQELLISLPAVGMALIWPCQDRKVPWKVYYAGIRRESMQPWLRARLNFSLDATLGVLQQDLSRLPDMPFPQILCLQPTTVSLGGLWIIWTSSTFLPGSVSALQKEVRSMLEALIEVESVEEYYFSSNSPLTDRALLDALGQADPHALSTLLGLVRLVGNADLTAWGRVYQDVVETSDHMGAKKSGFGFVLPRGEGIGGHIAVYGTPLVAIEDYRNSLYRYNEIVDIVDSEQVRSTIALPLHSRGRQEMTEYVAGILYATRRVVKPFSLAERLLVERMTHLLEPLNPLTRAPSFLSPSLPPVSAQKVAWSKLILSANHIESLETWVGQFIKGTVVVADSNGRPYVSSRSAQLENLRAAYESSVGGVQVISLDVPGASASGQVYMRSAITLPPRGWPDFFADLVVACNLLIGRMEQARDHLARNREQWLRALLREKSLLHIRQDGYRLGLPVTGGQLWVIAWPSQRPLSKQAARQRMLVENIVLDLLESPLLFLGDDIGVILLNEQMQEEPSKLREALLTQFAPHPFWVVYGARYQAFEDLKMLLTHSISLAQNARRDGNSENLLDMQTPGLENLLANPKLTEDLRNFATRLLTPLLEYDKSKGTDLTNTFVMVQMLGSMQTVSDELGVHVNTIRYRLHKAEDILGIEEASPQERIAWGFAAFIWTSLHQPEQIVYSNGS